MTKSTKDEAPEKGATASKADPKVEKEAVIGDEVLVTYRTTTGVLNVPARVTKRMEGDRLVCDVPTKPGRTCDMVCNPFGSEQLPTWRPVPQVAATKKD